MTTRIVATLVLLCGMAAVYDIGTAPLVLAQEPVPFDIVSGAGSEVIGTFSDPAVVTVVPGEGVAFILAAGDAPLYDNATTEERAAFCSVISRTVLDGPAVLAGCVGDPIPAAEGQPVGFSCVGPGSCTVQFASTATAVSLVAVDVPAEFGGTSYSGTVTPAAPPPTTTTTTTPTTTTTTAPPPPADDEATEYEALVTTALLAQVVGIWAIWARIGRPKGFAR